MPKVNPGAHRAKGAKQLNLHAAVLIPNYTNQMIIIASADSS